MKANDATPTRAATALRKITGWKLIQRRHEGATLPLLDVRDAAAFGARHIGGSINAPESQTTALVKKLQTLGSAILICDDGRLSSMVARTLGFCGFREVAYLEGGLAAWEAAGGRVVETTRSGFEHEIPPQPAPSAKPPEKPGFLDRLRLLVHA